MPQAQPEEVKIGSPPLLSIDQIIEMLVSLKNTVTPGSGDAFLTALKGASDTRRNTMIQVEWNQLKPKDFLALVFAEDIIAWALKIESEAKFFVSGMDTGSTICPSCGIKGYRNRTQELLSDKISGIGVRANGIACFVIDNADKYLWRNIQSAKSYTVDK